MPVIFWKATLVKIVIYLLTGSVPSKTSNKTKIYQQKNLYLDV